MRRQTLKEAAAFCVCLPAAAVPFSPLLALVLLLFGIVVTLWR